MELNVKDGISGAVKDSNSAEFLTVQFRSDISDMQLEQAGLPESVSVQQSRNAILRQDENCERLANAIAQQFGIELGSQVYLGRTRLAEYRLQDTARQPEIIAAINEQFGSLVVSVRPSLLASPAFTPDDPDYNNSGRFGGPQWYLHSMDFGSAWDVSLGSSSVIAAVLDSGCNLKHEELDGQVLDATELWPEASTDLADGDNIPEDEHGHGTAVCGLICAATDNGNTLAGAAPGCGVLPIRVTSDWTDFTLGRYIEAGYLARDLGADILLQSFTISEDSELVHAMLQDLAEDGMLLVAAAGNDADGTGNWPAAWPEVISVGSVDMDDSRSSFSNFADSVELAAPGRDLRICAHRHPSGALAYRIEQGTSLSAPLAAAAAALLWADDPSLDAPRVRELLSLTGRPSSGFGQAVPVVNAGALLARAGRLTLPQLPGMILSGELPLEVGVLLEPDSASLLLDDELVQQLDSAPWQFSLATQSQLFSDSSLTLLSETGQQQFKEEVHVVVDNTAGRYPLADDVEAESGSFIYFDAGRAQQQVRISLENQFLPDWTAESVSKYGRGKWQRIYDAAASGSYSWYCGELAEMEYDRDEFDCLVSARVDLQGAQQPVLRFIQRYNVQDDDFGYDRLSVLVSNDNGVNWQLLPGDGHAGWFSGYQPDWEVVELSLAAYIGESIHVCFSLQSDSLLEGEVANQPEGWWLDDIYVGEQEQQDTGFSIESPVSMELFGSVNGRQGIEVRLADVIDAASFSYRLDCRPYGIDNGEDLNLSNSESSSALLELGGIPRQNQSAWLIVESFDELGDLLHTELRQVLLFNQPGDVNADGLVNLLDAQHLQESMTLQDGEPGWHPFLDADLDGRVTELDLAAVGYYWDG